MELLSVLEPQDAQEVTRALDWTTAIGLFFAGGSGCGLLVERSQLRRFRIYLTANALKSEEGLLARRRIESHGQIGAHLQSTAASPINGLRSLYIETAALGMADGEISI